ncbi:MAG: hypothetical protein QOK13_1118 [Gaiellaceae bacterium]|nr:hypothetical protein [Gaiellaceae bacterium]
MRAYRTAVTLFALTFVGLGFVLLVVTALRGGGVGLVIGALFVALGGGRLYLLRMRK